NAINAARKHGRKSHERSWRLRLIADSARRAASRNRGRSGWRRDNRGAWRDDALFFADRGRIDRTVRSDGQRGEFAFRCFIKNEAFGRRPASRVFFFAFGLRRGARDAQDAAIGFRACDQIAVGIEGEYTDMGLVAGVEEFTLAVGWDSENLTFVAG